MKLKELAELTPREITNLLTDETHYWNYVAALRGDDIVPGSLVVKLYFTAFIRFKSSLKTTRALGIFSLISYIQRTLINNDVEVFMTAQISEHWAQHMFSALLVLQTLLDPVDRRICFALGDLLCELHEENRREEYIKYLVEEIRKILLSKIKEVR